MLISFVLSAGVELSDPEESLVGHFGRIALTGKQNKTNQEETRGSSGKGNNRPKK